MGDTEYLITFQGRLTANFSLRAELRTMNMILLIFDYRPSLRRKLSRTGTASKLEENTKRAYRQPTFSLAASAADSDAVAGKMSNVNTHLT